MADALDLLADAVTCDTITVDEMRVPIDGGYSSKMLNGSYYIVPNYNKNKEKIKMFLAN